MSIWEGDVRAFALVVGLLLVSGVAHSETDVCMRAVGFALTGSDDAEVYPSRLGDYRTVLALSFQGAALSGFFQIRRCLANIWRLPELCGVIAVLHSQAPRPRAHIFLVGGSGLISAKES
jgi:hypothetical protein